jgi:predicted peroxiredoxin
MILKEAEMDEEKKEAVTKETEQESKRDFLKVLGAGIGMAGMASFMGGPASAQADKKGKYIFVITHGADDVNRAILGLLLAQIAGDKGWGQVNVWLTLGGADLANKKRTEKIESPIYKPFGNAASIIKKIKDKGGWFGCCPPCAEFFGSTGGDKYDFVEMAGGDWLLKNVQDAWVLWL